MSDCPVFGRLTAMSLTERTRYLSQHPEHTEIANTVPFCLDRVELRDFKGIFQIFRLYDTRGDVRTPSADRYGHEPTVADDIRHYLGRRGTVVKAFEFKDYFPKLPATIDAASIESITLKVETSEPPPDYLQSLFGTITEFRELKLMLRNRDLDLNRFRGFRVSSLEISRSSKPDEHVVLKIHGLSPETRLDVGDFVELMETTVDNDHFNTIDRLLASMRKIRDTAAILKTGTCYQILMSDKSVEVLQNPSLKWIVGGELGGEQVGANCFRLPTADNREIVVYKREMKRYNVFDALLAEHGTAHANYPNVEVPTTPERNVFMRTLANFGSLLTNSKSSTSSSSESSGGGIRRRSASSHYERVPSFE